MAHGPSESNSDPVVDPQPLAVVAAEGGEPDLGVSPAKMQAASAPRAHHRADLLTGSIRPTVLSLALPVLGEQLFNAMVAWNDTFLAGRIDAVATAAVGFGAYLSWLVSLLFSLVGIGATAIVARNIGAKNPEDANRACNQAVVLSLVLGALATAAAYIFSPFLIGMLNLGPAASPVALSFIRIDALGYLAESLTFIGAACLRGAGDTRTPMKLIGTVNLVNAATSWLMTFGLGAFPGLGTNGIACGTAIARNVGGVLTLLLLWRGRDALRLRAGLLRLEWVWASRILRIGLPASIDGALMWLGHFAFMSILTRSPFVYSGDVLFAAHIVGIRIESLSYLPAFAWSLAASTLMGQNLGAGQPDRALACAREARFQALLLLIGTGSLYFFCAEPLYRLLTHDPRVIEVGVPALRALGIVQPFAATLIVYLGALRGAGDTLVPMTFTIVGIGCLRVPVAYVGGILMRGGLLGVWLGMFVDLAARAALMTWRLEAGRWRKIRV